MSQNPAFKGGAPTHVVYPFMTSWQTHSALQLPCIGRGTLSGSFCLDLLRILFQDFCMDKARIQDHVPAKHLLW